MRQLLLIMSLCSLLLYGCSKAGNPTQIETTDHSYLQQVAVYATEGPILGFDLTANQLYTAEDDCGVSVFTGPGTPASTFTRVDTLLLYQSQLVNAAANFNLLYCYRNSKNGQLVSMDITNPGSPQFLRKELGSYLGTTAMQCHPNTFNDPLYSLQDYPILNYYLRNTETRPVLSCNAYSVELGNTYFYQVDIPAAKVNDFCFTTDSSTGLARQTFYFAADQQGLLIATVQRDLNELFGVWSIATLSRTALPGEALALSVQGNYAYFACQHQGLQVVDITNPLSPQWLAQSQYLTKGYAQGIATYNNLLAMACGGYGLYLFSLQSPAKPTLLQHLTNPNYSYCYGVKFDDNGNLFLATRDMGVVQYLISN